MRLFLIRVALILFFCKIAHTAHSSSDIRIRPFRILFYNVENFFDIYENPATEDQEFTPSSFRRWDMAKFKHKCNQIGQVIAAVGEWRQAELVGLCEVESDTVLHYLTRYSALKELGYSYVMTRSDDPRGINVALLYQKETFRPIRDTAYRVDLTPPTRDLLHVTGILPSGDTLEVFVAHLPSKRGGVKTTDERRRKVLQSLFGACRLIRERSPLSPIVIMGDFNDESDRIAALSPVPVVYKAPFDEIDGSLFYALLPPAGRGEQGTYKYHGKWSRIDQFIVSGSLLLADRYPTVNKSDAHIFAPDFLLISDSEFGGKRPLRTYDGAQYRGGFSDHLPICFDLLLKY